MNPWRLGLLVAAASLLMAAGASSRWVSDSGTRQEMTDLSSEPKGAMTGLAAVALTAHDLSAPPELEVVHPLAALDDQQIGELAQRDPTALGSMSVGLPNRGALINAVEFPDSPIWKRADPIHAWGTRESVEFVEYAIRVVNREFENTPLLYIGDFSARGGGKLNPHKSHQSGRDVDIGYYYLHQSVWYARADAHNLDRARTWTMLKALLTHTPVEYVFMDKNIQPLLKEYALAQGEDPEWLSRVFGGTSKAGDPIVRHRFGHATHFHVRFENPTAEVTAHRLAQMGMLPGYRRHASRRPPPPAAVQSSNDE
jgi:murein endopeptidase